MHARGNVAHPHTSGEMDQVRDTKVRLPTGKDLLADLDESSGKFEFMENLQHRAEKMGVPTLRITYEDIVEKEEEAFAGVFDFLLQGVNATCGASDLAPQHGAMTRIHTEPSSTYVANWNAVKATLMKSPVYGKFVSDEHALHPYVKNGTRR